MRCLIQRVQQAKVVVDSHTIGAIDTGLLVFVCAMQGDALENVEKLSLKLSKLRIFRDEIGRMNKSIIDIDGSCLIVSQFTLAADTSRGNRPGFSEAADPELARALYEVFCSKVASLGIPVQTGEFGADMAVSLINDGPMTIWMDV